MDSIDLEKRLDSCNPAMIELMNDVRRSARSQATMLITGESGTGKELVARTIHEMSDRRNRRFVAINCAAVPETLLESELFGHERGAFTGAHCARRGLIHEADGGTLFLDEIGDMPLPLQAKLLRVLQEKIVTPIGSAHGRVVDFRLVAATHRDLRKSISDGRFRSDLYYRLNVIPLHIPALRERKEDIPHLAELFLGAAARRNRLPVPRLTPEAIRKLTSKRWDGNVRELENLLERLVVVGEGGVLTANDIPSDESPSAEGAFGDWLRKTLPTVDELVDDYILHVYRHVNGHQGRASEILGLSRRTIYRKLRKMSMAIPRAQVVTP